VATVSRLDWPPSTTLTPEQGRQSLDTLVDELDSNGSVWAWESPAPCIPENGSGLGSLVDVYT
jgi:hypothetical protein